MEHLSNADTGGGQEDYQSQQKKFRFRLLLLLFLVVSPLGSRLLDYFRTPAQSKRSLEFNGLPDGGEKLVTALSQSNCDGLLEINLEFAQGVEDEHILLIAEKVHSLKKLNLNACQKVTDAGICAVASANPNLESFSIYWNLKCLKLTDEGLIKLLTSCENLTELYLYAIPNFTDKAYEKFSNTPRLKLLDVCGAQFLSDVGLAGIAECTLLESLNLTWCVRVTDIGLKALAQHCVFLESLSLHGLLGVTDDGIEELSKSCKDTLHTLDVNGCVNIKRRSKDELLQLFPLLTTFVVHT
ncbi:hypothetical protein AXG93_2543s1010 [Marchantia polymorpha subsp. ruderalis]|uniref:F-box/LRR-repeat protein 15-like leucin rich repeat domain-containing protein n=1 Tax=Marchantia polymorpha subsp. ruderalis TaxID=1480154 RepID=A0A176VMI0_MARPO|nr:hypothetical protein AXG93_2543s1010 [Marchantia polymorpha subsp. ruderalis]